MKICTILYFIFIPLVSISQSNNEVFKNKWYGSNYVGFATIELKENTKYTASVYGIAISKEIFNLSSEFKLMTGLDYQRMSGNSSKQDDYTINHILKVPINLSYNLFASEKTIIPIHIGIYSGYLLKSNTENVSINQKNSESGLGFNFGLETFLGFTHFLNESVGFQFGVTSQGDLFQIYKNKFPEMQIKNLHAFRFGVLLDL